MYLSLPELASSLKNTSAALLIGFLVACAVVRVECARRTNKRLPPSPPSDFLIGHLRTIPSHYQWKSFAELGKTLGNIIYFSILGQPMIVLNSVEDARSILEKRSPIYSNRPRSVFAGELIGNGNSLVFLQFGERYRTQRRMMQQVFNSQAIRNFRQSQREQVLIFVNSLLDSRTNFFKASKRYNIATVIKATYGRDITSNDDEYIDLAEEAIKCVSEENAPGTMLVDMLPILRFLPSWFPGAGFQKRAALGRRATQRFLEIPYQDVKQQKADKGRGMSLMERLLDDYEELGREDPDHEVNIKFVAAQIYGAAIETSVIVFDTFLLMMITHPWAAKKAQEEIDRVVGTDRLPDFEDRESLPYIDCIFKEVLRFNPPAPLSVPHASTEDDEYEGMHIPSGSVIVPNIWYMMRDPKYFADAEKFQPERFLEKVKGAKSGEAALNELCNDDPSSIVFGFGRRTCPGRYFADANIWLGIACFLAVFNALPPFNPQTGEEEMPRIEFTSGFTSRVAPFSCRIVPRNNHLVQLVESLGA